MNEAGAVPVVRVKGLTRSFEQGGVVIDVLRGVDFAVRPGEIVALLGPSGSGKSTMLQAIGLLEGGFGGRIEIAGTEATSLDSDARTTLRRNHIGFVYQFHHLLPDFNAIENVVLPQLVADKPRAEAEARARDLLEALGLGARPEHRPSQLSGGEQQRVALARALANRPEVVLADEPTGNLDEATADRVFGEFVKLVRGEGSAALVATHNERLFGGMDRVCRRHEGSLRECAMAPPTELLARERLPRHSVSRSSLPGPSQRGSRPERRWQVPAARGRAEGSCLEDAAWRQPRSWLVRLTTRWKPRCSAKRPHSPQLGPC